MPATIYNAPAAAPAIFRVDRYSTPFTTYEAAAEFYSNFLKDARARGVDYSGGGETGPLAPKGEFVAEDGTVVAVMSWNGNVWLPADVARPMNGPARIVCKPTGCTYPIMEG